MIWIHVTVNGGRGVGGSAWCYSVGTCNGFCVARAYEYAWLVTAGDLPATNVPTMETVGPEANAR